MMRYAQTSSSTVLLAACFVLQPFSFLLAQGPLTPPGFGQPGAAVNAAGQPIATMKTLDQLEARTPIAQPATFPILITQPGSYYLTGTITGVSNTDGIRVSVGGVTIDLNGFEMVGLGSIGDGIDATVAISNVTIRNGVLRGWGDRGLNLENATNARIE